MDLSDLQPAVVIILLIGLVLGIGIYVMAEMRGQIATEYSGLDSDINITEETNNQTTLTDASLDDYELQTVSVVNDTGDTIPSTEYSYTVEGVITWSDDLSAGSTAYIVDENDTANVSSTYIYDAIDSPEAAVNDTMEGLGDFGGWIAVIVVVIAAAVVLGIVLKSFGQGARA